jgi:hypothetical protein
MPKKPEVAVSSALSAAMKASASACSGLRVLNLLTMAPASVKHTHVHAHSVQADAQWAEAHMKH